MNVFDYPRCRASDLGLPIPDSPHACSMALPTWQSVIDYEERVPEVIAALKSGYPRFVLNPLVVRLHEKVLADEGAAGESAVLIFSDADAAARCAAFVDERSSESGEMRVAGDRVFFRSEVSRKSALEYWRYAGDGVSSRAAEAMLEGTSIDREQAEHAQLSIRSAIANEHGVDAVDVVLVPSGMAAIATIHRAFQSLHEDGRFVQVDFPYVDAMRVQRHFGARQSEMVILDEAGEPSRDYYEMFADGRVAGVFVECPSNPLLRCADLQALRDAAGDAIPIAFDDTVSTSRTVEVLPWADVITTSLTKWWAGSGDIMAGAIVINPRGPQAEKIRGALNAAKPSSLCDADAVRLATLVGGFKERVRKAGENADRLLALLKAEDLVTKLWHPSVETVENFARIAKHDGPTTALLSFRLAGGESVAARFYDALELNKGPSLGTDFTLVCPYVLLAHYDELAWAEELGAPRDLLRVSVGTEDWETIRSAFERAFAAAKNPV